MLMSGAWKRFLVLSLSVSTVSCFLEPHGKSPYRRWRLHGTKGGRFPEPTDSNFGNLEYWDKNYRDTEDGLAFSWYSGWGDLGPFVEELIPDCRSRVLIPGMGNDATVADMYDAGYKSLTAFDYAPEGVQCAKRLLGPDRSGVSLLVADARDLPFASGSFDAVLDKRYPGRSLPVRRARQRTRERASWSGSAGAGPGSTGGWCGRKRLGSLCGPRTSSFRGGARRVAGST
mmetsp:Transcript_38902/g.52739  ORF Transcript_38902/g.52739 Transcript_38902/m.52739 type:complete len:230 (+) Transcript_38902:30-719(+)